MMADGSGWSAGGLLKTAFFAAAGCIVVHGLFDYMALAGVNPWELTSYVTDGLSYAFNGVGASPAAAATVIPPPLSGAESLAAPSAQNALPEGCHYHLGNPEPHCAPDSAPSVEW